MDTLISILLTAIMIAALAGLRIARRKRKSQQLQLLLLVPALLAAGYFLYHTGFLGDIGIGRSRVQRLTDRESAIFCSQAYKVAAYFRDRHQSSEKLLVLVEDNPLSRKQNLAFRQTLIDAGIPEAQLVLDTVFAADELPDNPMPTLFRMSAADFDQALRRHPDCTVVVSLVGIPARGARNLDIIQGRGKRKLILLGSIPDTGVVQYGLANGSIAFVVMANPEQTSTGNTLPTSQDEIFDLRYVMYTAANAAAMR